MFLLAINNNLEIKTVLCVDQNTPQLKLRPMQQLKSLWHSNIQMSCYNGTSNGIDLVPPLQHLHACSLQ